MTYQPTVEEQEEYDRRLGVANTQEAVVPSYTLDGRRKAWEPQPGSQVAFMRSPYFEVLYHGTRGPGKTDALLMSFAQHVGKGFGAAWRGIIFRQTYPQLADIEAKSRKWFNMIFPEAKFNRAKMMWEWPTGEVLLFRHMSKASDYFNYHGHEYPFIGWEELTSWPTDECFKVMFACCRTSTPGVPRMIRATTNPYGVGHNWVKERYNLHGKWWLDQIQLHPKDDAGRLQPSRCAIHGHIDENKILLRADPDYKMTIIAAASNPAMAEAWLDGSWDIVSGGIFDDVWSAAIHIVEPFPIPQCWRIDRSFDWGSSAPFSVGWWAESDGTDVRTPRGVLSTVKGDLFRINEWYGWSGQPNVGLRMLAGEISEGIVERELKNGWLGRVKPGPADGSIYDEVNGMCIANDMLRPVRIKGKQLAGVAWTRADKSPGSVIQGIEQIRKMFKNAKRRNGKPREFPGLFVFNHCHQFIRTVPPAPRDEKKIDEIDDNWEDHVCDEVRYRVRADKRLARSVRTRGMV